MTAGNSDCGPLANSLKKFSNLNGGEIEWHNAKHIYFAHV